MNNNEDLKTMKEHLDIVINYKNYGVLDRDDAIEKYKKFNLNHPDYTITINGSGAICGTLIPVEQGSDEIIVNNILSQLVYLLGMYGIKLNH